MGPRGCTRAASGGYRTVPAPAIICLFCGVIRGGRISTTRPAFAASGLSRASAAVTMVTAILLLNLRTRYIWRATQYILQHADQAMMRSHYCGEVNAQAIDDSVTVCG